MNNQMTEHTTNAHPEQANGWALIPVGSSAVFYDTYQTSTGFWVNVKTVYSSHSSSVEVDVSDDTAYAVACKVTFGAHDHEHLCADFLKSYLDGPAIKNVCAHFDELCIPYDMDDDEDEVA